MTFTNHVRHGIVAAAAILTFAVPPAIAANRPHISRVVPDEAVSGAALDVRVWV